MIHQPLLPVQAMPIQHHAPQPAPYPFTAAVAVTPCCGAQYEPASLFNFVNTYGVCPIDRQSLNAERIAVVQNPINTTIIIHHQVAKPGFSLMNFLWEATKSIGQFTFKMLQKTCEILWEVVKFALKALAVVAVAAAVIAAPVALCIMAPEAAFVIGMNLLLLGTAFAVAKLDAQNGRDTHVHLHAFSNTHIHVPHYRHRHRQCC